MRPIGFALIASLLVLAAGCSSEQAAIAPARLSFEEPGDALTMVMPTTGPETRSAQGLDAFTHAVSRQVSLICLAPYGLGLAEVPPPMFVRFYDIPDLPFIEAHGFGDAVLPELPPPPTKVRIGPNVTDATAVRRTCLAQGEARVRELRELTSAMQQSWPARLRMIDADPAVLAAYRRFPPCLRDHGVNAADEDTFFRLVDTRPKDEGRLAHAYAVCMRPVEDAREPLRVRLRDEQIAGHPDAVERIRRDLPRKIDELAERYDIRPSFPAL